MNKPDPNVDPQAIPDIIDYVTPHPNNPNVSQVVVTTNYGRTIVGTRALIDTIFAPWVTKFTWTLWNGTSPPKTNVLLPSDSGTYRSSPVFLHRLIVLLAEADNDAERDRLCDDIDYLINKLKDLQQLRLHRRNQFFDCRLANINKSLTKRGQELNLKRRSDRKAEQVIKANQGLVVDPVADSQAEYDAKVASGEIVEPRTLEQIRADEELERQRQAATVNDIFAILREGEAKSAKPTEPTTNVASAEPVSIPPPDPITGFQLTPEEVKKIEADAPPPPSQLE